MLALDTQHRVIGEHVVHVGGLGEVHVEPRAIFRPLIANNAHAGILCHNHPSGDPTPSQADLLMTARLVACGGLLGVTIVDHVIVGSEGWISLRTEIERMSPEVLAQLGLKAG